MNEDSFGDLMYGLLLMLDRLPAAQRARAKRFMLHALRGDPATMTAVERYGAREICAAQMIEAAKQPVIRAAGARVIPFG
jgi:hypothetical protein